MSSPSPKKQKTSLETPITAPTAMSDPSPPKCPLLDLPPEIFGIVVDHVFSSPLPKYNKHNHLEYDDRLRRPVEQDRRDFTSLIMTCKKAKWLGYGARKPKCFHHVLGDLKDCYNEKELVVLNRDVKLLRGRASTERYISTRYGLIILSKAGVGLRGFWCRYLDLAVGLSCAVAGVLAFLPMMRRLEGVRYIARNPDPTVEVVPATSPISRATYT